MGHLLAPVSRPPWISNVPLLLLQSASVQIWVVEFRQGCLQGQSQQSLG